MLGIGLCVLGIALIIAVNILDNGLTAIEIVGGVLILIGIIFTGIICIGYSLSSSAEQRNLFKWQTIVGIGLLIIGFIVIYGNTIWNGNLTPWQLFSAVLIVIGVFCTLTYFFFSVEHRGAIQWTSKIGIGFLMIGFGAAFGNTVMGRLALMIHRVGFLINDWLGSIVALFG